MTGLAIGRGIFSFDRQEDWQSAGVQKAEYFLGSAVAAPGCSFAAEESWHSSAAKLPAVFDVQQAVPSGANASAVEVRPEA